MPRWGMAIDLDRCTGCQACVVACKVENNVPCVTPEESARGRSMLWLEVIPYGEEGKRRLMPRPCMQCANPPCTKVCPVGATYLNPEGIVAQVYPRCIGCRYCTNNCPYTVKSFNFYEPVWTPAEREGLNPDVSIRTKGVVEKCTFCHHRMIRAREQVRAEGRELREADVLPACAEVCPTEAILFGDLEDPGSPVAAAARSTRAFRMLEDLGTEPGVFYLAEGGGHEE